MSFHYKLESIQYNACLAMTGAIRATSKEKLYQELRITSVMMLVQKIRKVLQNYKNKSPNIFLS